MDYTTWPTYHSLIKPQLIIGLPLNYIFVISALSYISIILGGQIWYTAIAILLFTIGQKLTAIDSYFFDYLIKNSNQKVWLD